VALRDRFDTDGILTEGPVRQRIDDVVICDPWPASLSEIESVLGSSSASRRAVFHHLVGFLSWFDSAFVLDPAREVWIRGRFASTLAPEVDDLDVVVHYSNAWVAHGDRWVLLVLTAEPINLEPVRLVVTPLRHDGTEYSFERDKEARRSRVRAFRPETREQVVAGWIRLVGEEGDG
jgi:hypothetical protein